MPTYLRRQLIDLLAVMLQSNASRNRHRSRHRMINSSLFMVMHNHYTSYDMVMRLMVLFRNPPMANPMEELTSYNFYHYYGFWPDQFIEICNNLILIPNVVIFDHTRCSARKKLALLLLLWQWNKADTWEDVAFLPRHGCFWCIQIHRKIVSLLKRHYKICVQVLDYH